MLASQVPRRPAIQPQYQDPQRPPLRAHGRSERGLTGQCYPALRLMHPHKIVSRGDKSGRGCTELGNPSVRNADRRHRDFQAHQAIPAFPWGWKHHMHQASHGAFHAFSIRKGSMTPFPPKELAADNLSETPGQAAGQGSRSIPPRVGILRPHDHIILFRLSVAHSQSHGIWWILTPQKAVGSGQFRGQ